MKNGSMFKDIVKYKDEEYFKEHQDITVYTPEREYHLRPMSVLYTEPTGMRRKTKFATEESFQAYVEEMTKAVICTDPGETAGAALVLHHLQL